MSFDYPRKRRGRSGELCFVIHCRNPEASDEIPLEMLNADRKCSDLEDFSGIFGVYTDYCECTEAVAKYLKRGIPSQPKIMAIVQIEANKELEMDEIGRNEPILKILTYNKELQRWGVDWQDPIIKKYEIKVSKREIMTHVNFEKSRYLEVQEIQ
jgi:hypothetical protein